MCSLMNVKVRLLMEGLAAVLDVAPIALLATFRVRGFFVLKFLMRELVELTCLSRMRMSAAVRGSLPERRVKRNTYHRAFLFQRRCLWVCGLGLENFHKVIDFGIKMDFCSTVHGSRKSYDFRGGGNKGCRDR
jgi:hypothetical protein